MPAFVTYPQSNVYFPLWVVTLKRFGEDPQFELLDFARRGFGQLHKQHLFGAFEARKFGAHKGDDLGLVTHGTLFEFHKGAGHFAPFLICFGDHGTQAHAGVAHQRAFDLDRTDVLAARNNQAR